LAVGKNDEELRDTGTSQWSIHFSNNMNNQLSNSMGKILTEKMKVASGQEIPPNIYGN
jgi:hypothetical protein